MVRFKSILKGIGVFGLLFIIDLIIQSIYLIATKPGSSIATIVIICIMMLATEVLLLVPLLHVLGLKHDAFVFEKIKGEDIVTAIKYVSIILFGNIALNLGHLLIIGKKATEAENQSSLESLATPSMMIGLVILVVFVAPFVEELMFRGAIMAFIVNDTNKWFQIAVSGMAFGLFHLIGNDWQTFAFIQYSFMGMVLAHAYMQRQRVEYSIMVHMGNNLLAVIPLIILAFK